VQRWRSPRDVRAYMIRLTPKGQELLLGLLPELESVRECLFAELCSDNQTKFKETIDILARGLPAVRD
jgi:DNA-binding MarR family transcriptional regulator